jgi:hypothetical protein
MASASAHRAGLPNPLGSTSTPYVSYGPWSWFESDESLYYMSRIKLLQRKSLLTCFLTGGFGGFGPTPMMEFPRNHTCWPPVAR